MLSIKAWASLLERFLMILAWFGFEETIVIREILSSVESALLVSDFHVGWSLRV